MAESAICEHDWRPSALGQRCRECGATMRVVTPRPRKHELVFNEIEKTVQRSLGLAFADDQEMAIRKAIISAFIAYENFDGEETPPLAHPRDDG